MPSLGALSKSTVEGEDTVKWSDRGRLKEERQ
jgi:hypothetical protein